MVTRLLVVEDEPEIEQVFLSYYHKEIQEKQYEFIFSQTGKAALEIIESDRRIDLIIADFKSPKAKLDGLELIRTLNKLHIDLKIILMTADGKEHLLTDEDKENVIFHLNKDQSNSSVKHLNNLPQSYLDQSLLKTLKYLIDFSTNFPDRLDSKSRHVRLDTLIKVIKDLSEKQKIKLFKNLVNYCRYPTLKWLQEELPQQIEGVLEKSFRQENLRKWLLEKQQEEKLPSEIPLEKIEYFFLEARTNSSGLFYWIKWSDQGKWNSKYLSKKLIEDELPLEFRKNIKGLNEEAQS